MLRKLTQMRFLVIVAGICAAAMVIAGCGGGGSSSGSGGGATAGGESGGGEETVKVGLVQEDHASAEPWAASMTEAVEKVKEEDPNVEFTESFTAEEPQQAVPVMQQFANGGYNVIIGHSFFLEDAMRTLAQEFPEIPMSGASFKPPLKPNLSVELPSYLETGYAIGWMLSKLSETDKVAVVGAEPAPYATEILQGFKLGAKAANPEVEVLSAWSDSFTDQQATQQQANALLEEGADGLLPLSATEDSLGGFKLCEQKKVNCASWAVDGKRYAPTTNVVSVVIDWSQPIEELVKAAREGKPFAKTWDGTFENGGLVIPELSPAASKRVPSAVAKEFETIVEELADEKISLPPSKAHPGYR